jgi:hyperosmotically inducible periplasmic protein
MKFIRKTLVAPAALAAVCLFVPVFATAQAAPDNTKQNQDHATTADSQSNASADRVTTAKVRKAIVADKNLSTYAHNVKIITSNGQVTLKGPVKSEEEKQQIASDASSVVSAENISNQLTIKQ